MKPLTDQQRIIINKINGAYLGGRLQLTLEQPIHIARKYDTSQIRAWHYTPGAYHPTAYIKGYVKAAEGLRQRGLLIRDSGDCRYWLTSYGIDYIKGLQS